MMLHICYGSCIYSSCVASLLYSFLYIYIYIAISIYTCSVYIRKDCMHVDEPRRSAHTNHSARVYKKTHTHKHTTHKHTYIFIYLYLYIYTRTYITMHAYRCSRPSLVLLPRSLKPADQEYPAMPSRCLTARRLVRVPTQQQAAAAAHRLLSVHRRAGG